MVRENKCKSDSSTNKILDFDSRCRACMRQFAIRSTRIDLLDNLSKLPMEFAECCGKIESNFPRYLCEACAKKTTAFYQFKQMCLESENKFKEWISVKMPYKTKSIKIITASTQISDRCFAIGDKKPRKSKRCRLTDATEHESLNEHNTSETDSRYAETSAIRYKNTHTIVKRSRPADSSDGETPSVELISPGTLSSCDPEAPSLRKSRSATKRLRLSIASDDKINTTEHILPEIRLSSAESRVGRRQSVENLEYTIVNHAKQSKNTEKFQCSLCPKVFWTEHTFTGHMRTHQGLAPYPCDREGCNKSFISVTYLRRHLDRHDGTMPSFPCRLNDCDQIFASNSKLQYHKQVDHARGIQSYVCEDCGKVLKTHSSLSSHRYLHMDRSEWPLECDYPNCGRRFIGRSNLNDHRLRHDGIKKFKCTICDEYQITKAELAVHLNLHTMERQYPCTICSQIFYAGAQLRLHVNRVHNNKKQMFYCRYCRDEFYTDHQRNKHETTHDNYETHECRECERSFASARNLKLHMRKKHNQNSLVENDTYLAEGAQNTSESEWDQESITVVDESDNAQECPERGGNFAEEITLSLPIEQIHPQTVLWEIQNKDDDENNATIAFEELLADED